MKGKRVIACILAGVMMVGCLVPGSMAQAAKKKVSLSKKTLSLYKGKTYKLKVKNTKKKVKWSSSKKKVATVTQKGLVKAKGKGKAKITAKVGGKKYSCWVTVKLKKKAVSTKKPAASKTPTAKPTSAGTAEEKPSAVPSGPSDTDAEPTSPSGVTEEPSAKPTDASGTTQNPSAKPTDAGGTSQKPSASPSSSVPTPKPAASALKASTMLDTVSIGMTKAELAAKYGEPDREDKSPLGFDTYVYCDSKYSAYLMVNFEQDKAVTIFGMGTGIAYNTVVPASATLSSLSADESWSRVSWYDATTTAGKVGEATYQKNLDDVRVLAFTDYYSADKKVFALQLIAKEYSVKDVSEPGDNCRYGGSIVSDMEAEIFAMLNVYRVMHGCAAFQENSGMNTVAKGGSEILADAGSKEVTPRTSIVKELRAQKIDPDAWSEEVFYGSIDSVGFLVSFVQMEESREDLIEMRTLKGENINYRYDKMGVGCVCVGEGKNCMNYLTVDLAWEDPDWCL